MSLFILYVFKTQQTGSVATEGIKWNKWAKDGTQAWAAGINTVCAPAGKPQRHPLYGFWCFMLRLLFLMHIQLELNLPALSLFGEADNAKELLQCPFKFVVDKPTMAEIQFYAATL